MSETPRQPSQEELEAMYMQMRETPVQNYILQGLSLIQSGAQAKIGQPDAETLMGVVDAGFGAAGVHLAEEKAQRDQMMKQLRDAPMSEIIVQGISMIAQGVEIKIGRPDARILIDLLDGLVKTSGELMGDMKDKVEDKVSQLKAAQVQAEAKIAEQGGEPAAQSAGQPAAPKAEKKETDKLWIPGK